MLRLRSICGILGLLFLVLDSQVQCGLQLTSENLLKSFYDRYATKEDVEFISFSRNNMESIAEDTFKECTNLRILFITENPLHEFPKDTLKYNTELRICNLNQLLITELHSDTFSSLRNMRHLYVHSTLLQEIDEGLFRNNINLVELYLGHNNISRIHPKTFENLTNLKFIALRTNHLTTLPANVFAKNLKLEEVDLQFNKFKILPTNAVAPLINLMTIDLGSTSEEYFDLNALSTNTQLQLIVLSGYRLKKIGSYNHAQKLFSNLRRFVVDDHHFHCDYHANVSDYFRSINVEFLAIHSPTGCIPFGEYNDIVEERSEFYPIQQTSYEFNNPSTSLNDDEEIMFTQLLKEQRDCESGVQNLKLSILHVC